MFSSVQFVLGWVQHDGIFESLGELGILFLMFLAGHELDLDEVQSESLRAGGFSAAALGFPSGLSSSHI